MIARHHYCPRQFKLHPIPTNKTTNTIKITINNNVNHLNSTNAKNTNMTAQKLTGTTNITGETQSKQNKTKECRQTFYPCRHTATAAAVATTEEQKRTAREWALLSCRAV